VVGHAASPTCTVYVYVTVTPSKVKVKVTEHLNFRQLSKPCMLAAMTAAPLRGFLVIYRLRSEANLLCKSQNKYHDQISG